MAAVKHPLGLEVPQFVTIALDTTFVPPLRGLRVAAAGDVAIIDTGGITRTIVNVLAGETIKGGIQQVLTTGTTVTSPTTNIVGLR